MNKDFKKISFNEVTVSDDFYFIEDAIFEAPDGKQYNRMVLRHPGAVTILPITNDNKIVFVSQYRVGVEQYVLEVPAGRVDKLGENLGEVAERELLEETGYKASSYEYVGGQFMGPGFTQEVMHFYIAKGCEKVADTSPDDGEEQYMSTHVFGVDSVKNMLRNGEIKDIKTSYILNHYFLFG